jgi:hypothetical protein
MPWLDHLSIEAIDGDIFACSADALMCPVDISLHAYGAIGNRAYQLGATSLEATIEKSRSSLVDGTIPLGESLPLVLQSQLPTTQFSHLILTALWAKENAYSENLYYKSYLTAIRAAEVLGMRSLALPALGYDNTILMSCSALVRVIDDLNSLPRSSDLQLEELLIVSNSSHHARPLQNSVDRIYRL